MVFLQQLVAEMPSPGPHPIWRQAVAELTKPAFRPILRQLVAEMLKPVFRHLLDYGVTPAQQFLFFNDAAADIPVEQDHLAVNHT